MQKVNYNGREITPSKVICVGRNYVEHIEELGNKLPSSMVLFNKPNSAIYNRVKYYREHTRFEGEISFLIRSGEIVGVGFGLDLTHADIQNYLKSRGLPWERAKAFNGSAIFSNFVPFNIRDIESLKMRLYRNNSIVQFANYELMIYKPQEIIDEIESFMRVEDGDIIMTGTPKGVSNYSKGDIFVGEILSNDKLLIKVEWVVD